MEKALIIIPTYNEISNIDILIKKIFDVTRDNEFNINYRVLIIDDNSPDGTGKRAEELSKIYPVSVIHRERKLGLGTAYITGFKWALENNFDYIYEMDADLSHDPVFLIEFIKEIKRSGAGCVIGSRFYQWRVSVTNWHLKRLLLSLLGHRYARFILGNMNIYDTTSGFKCFRKEALEKINLEHIKSAGYIFQLELNYRLTKKNIKLIEIPIVFRDRECDASKMSWYILIEGLWIPLKLRFLYAIKGQQF